MHISRNNFGMMLQFHSYFKFLLSIAGKIYNLTRKINIEGNLTWLAIYLSQQDKIGYTAQSSSELNWGCVCLHMKYRTSLLWVRRVGLWSFQCVCVHVQLLGIFCCSQCTDECGYIHMAGLKKYRLMLALHCNSCKWNNIHLRYTKGIVTGKIACE